MEVRGPRAKFALRAHDGVDEIGAGTHERFIVSWDRFHRGIDAKLARPPPRRTLDVLRQHNDPLGLAARYPCFGRRRRQLGVHARNRARA